MSHNRPEAGLLNDMLLRGAHPFPADMEEMLRRIHAHDPSLVDNLDHRYFSGWNAGQELPAGRALLKAITMYVSTHQMQPNHESNPTVV